MYRWKLLFKDKWWNQSINLFVQLIYSFCLFLAPWKSFRYCPLILLTRFLIPECLMQIIDCLVHSSSQLRAWSPLVIIIPWFDQQILVFLRYSQILVLVQREKVSLLILVVENDLSLWSWSCVMVKLCPWLIVLLDCQVIVKELGWWLKILLRWGSNWVVLYFLLPYRMMRGGFCAVVRFLRHSFLE